MLICLHFWHSFFPSAILPHSPPPPHPLTHPSLPCPYFFFLYPLNKGGCFDVGVGGGGEEPSCVCLCASSERYLKHVMVVHHHDLEWHAQKLGYNLDVKVTVRAYKIKIWPFSLCYLNYDSFATKLSMMVDHYKSISQSVLCSASSSRLKCSGLLSEQYLLNCVTFCKQTWYGHESSRAGVLCEKTALLSSRSRSQWGLVTIIKI